MGARSTEGLTATISDGANTVRGTGIKSIISDPITIDIFKSVRIFFIGFKILVLLNTPQE